MTLTLDRARAALLVMDYQNGVVEQVPDGDALLARVANALSAARESGVAIGYVRVAFTDDDVAAIPATNRTFARLADGGRGLYDGSPATQIHERVAPWSGDIVVRKTRVGAFSTTDLDEQLRARGIDTLLLAGIATSGVVLSTVRDAADRDYRLVVLADLCADRDPEVHDLLTTRVIPRQADVVTSAELSALLQGS